MATEHVNCVDAQRHEPKGADAATSGEVYVSDGANSGDWKYLPVGSIDTTGATDGQIWIADGAGGGAFTSVNNTNKIVVTAVIDDISTAGSHWVTIPLAGDIIGISSVIDGAITLADATLSFEIGGVAITNGGITIAFSGSAAGDVDTSTPTGNNTVTANQAVELITDGGSTDVAKATITLLVDVS